MSVQTVSVIIPTYNRKEYLRDTLDSLRNQIFPMGRCEVIVVDDGSVDGTEEVVRGTFPFTVRYLKQENKGDALARNHGAQRSEADVLVFLDDDMIVAPDYLSHLIYEFEQGVDRVQIVVGVAHLWLKDNNPLVHSAYKPPNSAEGPSSVEIPFAEVCSNNMAVARKSYLSLGMMHDLGFPGSSIWCDVDFAYRAYRCGFAFRQSTRAISWHRDYAARTVESQSARMHTVAYRAVALLQKHPELLDHLPMFEDKTPIAWRRDSVRLMVRKLVRRASSSRPLLWSMEGLAGVLGTCLAVRDRQGPLYRWILGAYICRGYREGLRDLQAQGGPRRPRSTMLSS